MTTSELFSLRGRRALITGSGQGLGLRFARGLADAGAAIVLNDIDRDRLELAVAELRSAGVDTNGLLFNVAKPEEVHREIGEFQRVNGSIDVLVNNAGIHRYAALAEMTLPQWQEVIDV